MKISLELKDAPKYRRVESVQVDQRVHPGVTISSLITAAKINRPWLKIIDIRVDLR